jgi:inosine-uridine nucleoside N-ribohydrolase
MRVHLDTDIGGDMDDMCALALLLASPGVEITGITTVADHDGKRAGYARYALGLAGRSDVAVAAGTDVRSGYFHLPVGLPSEERYWPERIEPVPGPLEAALDLIARSVEAGAIVIGIGPYTNLSLLERRTPGTLRSARVYLMGGSIFPAHQGFPAWSNETDYNIQADPIAARHVLESASTTLVPLEITAQTALRQSHLAALGSGGPLAKLIARQALAFADDWRNDERYGESCAGVPDDIINFQHDPIACAVALGWDGVTIQDVSLAVEMEAGSLRERIAVTGHAHRVVTAVDGPRFNSFWVERVTG